MIRIAIVFAGLMGASGVALAAAAAHGDNARLGPASAMLLAHAPAILAVAALSDRAMLHPTLGLLAAAGLTLGALLFAGDLVLRSWLGHGLFPMAAPTGGMMLIASWVALAVAGMLPLR